MYQKCDRLYPSAQLENNDIEQRLEKKERMFNKYINNIKEMITYFKDKNHKSKRRYRKYKTLTSIIESIDTLVIIEATAASIKLSVPGVGLMVVPFSTGIACSPSLGNKSTT